MKQPIYGKSKAAETLRLIVQEHPNPKLINRKISRILLRFNFHLAEVQKNIGLKEESPHGCSGTLPYIEQLIKKDYLKQCSSVFKNAEDEKVKTFLKNVINSKVG